MSFNAIHEISEFTVKCGKCACFNVYQKENNYPHLHKSISAQHSFQRIW